MKNKSWGLISAHRNAVSPLWTRCTAAEEKISNIDATTAGRFKQPEAGKLYMRVFGAWWGFTFRNRASLRQPEREGRSCELIRVDLLALRSFPFSNPLQRWNEKRGRADLCIQPSNGMPYFGSEGASPGMGRHEQGKRNKVEGNK